VKTFICDLDCIVLDLLPPWVDWINFTFGTQLKVEGITKYEMHELCHAKWGVYDFFKVPGNYSNCSPIDGAVDGLKSLQALGLDVVIASALAGNQAQEKYDWCKKHLPFISKSNVMVGGRKELLRGDFLFDDAPKNHIKFGEVNPGARRLAIAYPYNKSLFKAVDCYARDYRSPRAAWNMVVEYVSMAVQG